MIEWLSKNKIGIQVSLDDLETSKPLHDGKSSSSLVLENIKRLQEGEIPFSINTVLDYEHTKSLRNLVDYICSIKKLSQWGLSASFTLNDDTYVDDIIDVMKLGILQLRDNGFDVRNNLRFYNEVVNQPDMTCPVGKNSMALGTNLEVWPCQSLIDRPPLGVFDEHIKELLETSEGNRYFHNRTLLPQCTDCGVLNWCRGGYRAIHSTDKKAVDVTCRIKQEIVPFILQETQNFGYGGNGNCNCNHNHSHQPEQDDTFDNIIKNYLVDFPKSDIKPTFVKTPMLED